jgi:hypothetical protein
VLKRQPLNALESRSDPALKAKTLIGTQAIGGNQSLQVSLDNEQFRRKASPVKGRAEPRTKSSGRTKSGRHKATHNK